MLFSMTGYGSGSGVSGEYTVSVSLQSVNNRFLEVRLRMPSTFSCFESKIRKELEKNFIRGEITLTAELNVSDGSLGIYRLNRSALNVYSKLLAEVEESGIKTAPLSLRELLSLDDVVEKNLAPDSQNQIEKALELAMVQAMDTLRQCRYVKEKIFHLILITELMQSRK